ncbi:MAG: T9SS type A sorting domain-containing protein [Candidatus Latescibacterota bacterium]|nr:MAG: T9SS type A sorting domain-containing protein [Candidatus Latescibacterota bacterium]
MRPARALLVGLGFLLASMPLLGVGHIQAREQAKPTKRFQIYNDKSDQPRTQHRGFFVSAHVDTYLLGEWNFDTGGIPDPQGWVAFDRTAMDTFFHVDDFDGLNGGDYGRLTPLEGQQSMWCGVRTSSDPPFCDWGCLPGYGNNWDQKFESTEFTVVGDAFLSYKVRWDSEPGYDWTTVEYYHATNGWTELPVDGGAYKYEGIGQLDETLLIDSASTSGTLKVRFRFISDSGWSDEDCVHDTDGAIIIDSLTVTDGTGTVDYQDFESEPVGSHTTADGDWIAAAREAFGDYSGLFLGLTVRQEDPCKTNISSLWGFFNGSDILYNISLCGDVMGAPVFLTVDPDSQLAVPGGKIVDTDNWEVVEIDNEIWSPPVDWSQDKYGTPIPGTASDAYIELDVYRDNPLDCYLFWRWGVRSILPNGCAVWKDNSFPYYGDQKEWQRYRLSFANLVEPGAVQIQIALGVIDMCHAWCIYGPPNDYHAHGPLFDNVRVVRVGQNGPVWSVRDIELFQDNFAADGTTTGKVRVDMADDILWSSNPNIRPGDSTVVTVSEPNVGLDYHSTGIPASGPAVYIHVKDVPPGKSGAAISGDLSRWPLVSASGGWTVLRMDTVHTGAGAPVDDKFCVDLNDDLYVPGDTIWFYFSARDASAQTTYWSRLTGTTGSQVEVLSAPMEMTCLPANALSGATDILYVDNFDQWGAQPYFDDAFRTLAVVPDRYDVRGPSSMAGNGLGSRVVNTASQISSVYKKILWNSGTLSSGTIGDGITYSKSDDFAVLFEFLDERDGPAGIYISGDDVAHEWRYLAGPNALAVKNTYMNFDLVHGNHVALGEPLSPLVIGQPGSLFDHTTGPDTLVAYGGCPSINDFDVLVATGGAIVAAAYSNNPANGAVLVQSTVNQADSIARVVLSGFSYHFIHDDRRKVLMDRVEHLGDILTWLENDLGEVTDVPDVPVFENSLAQNHPNPFNPVTTIDYSIHDRGHVSIRVYDVRGKLVRTLVDEIKTPRAGGYSVEWNGRNDLGQPVSSGVYFYRMTAPGFVKTKKTVLLK